jgi:hypothetical protein
MAANFAGVSGANDSRNDIIIRGNSPLGILWRLNGLDIPNPNHFGDGQGSTSGIISMINSTSLANSDFIHSTCNLNFEHLFFPLLILNNVFLYFRCNNHPFYPFHV